jgi:hypothetical protein
MAEEQHAIEVFSRNQLTAEPYFVEEVRLEAAERTFIAHAFLLPLTSITSSARGQPSSRTEAAQVLLVQGGPVITGMTLSVLNYLDLQGRALLLKDLGVEKNGLHHYFVKTIRTLRGAEFNAALSHQYPRDA